MRFVCLEALTLLLAAVAAGAVSIYITDLPAYSSLAECAQYAASYFVLSMTNSRCPTPADQLQSCACTKDQNSVGILSTLTSGVLYQCASTATEDVSSVVAVFSAYCAGNIDAPTNPATTTNAGGSTNTAGTMTAAPAPANTVSQYITDLSAFSDLVNCAQTALSYRVQSLTNSLCPTGAPELASCACTKNQNSLAVSSALKSAVNSACGGTEDALSVQAVFAGYCGLANGSSVFPTPSPLAGAVSYYITDLPQYGSLAPCAQTGLASHIQAWTNSYCNSPPLSLVSCACVKDGSPGGNSLQLSKYIRSDVGYYCGTTASADISSALGVFDYYCSAGKGLVTPAGITIAPDTNTAATRTGTSLPTRTGSGSGSTYTSPSSSPLTFGSLTPIGAIAGGVVAGGAVIIILLIIWWRYRRNHRRPPFPPPEFPNPSNVPPPTNYPPPSPYASKPELDNTGVLPVQSKISRKPAPVVRTEEEVSPVDEKKVNIFEPASEMSSPPAPYRAEAPGGREAHAYEMQNQDLRSEMNGQPNVHEMQNESRRHEVQGSHQHPVELSSPRPAANMNEGPLYEMDGNYHGRY